MQVNTMYQAQNMQQMHNEMGQGHGRGMGRIMRNLSQDQRQEVSQLLQSLPQDERRSAVEQIKSLDVSNMSQDQLYQSVMDILNPNSSQDLLAASTSGINLYA